MISLQEERGSGLAMVCFVIQACKGAWQLCMAAREGDADWASSQCQFQLLVYRTCSLLIIIFQFMHGIQGQYSLRYPCHILTLTASCLHHKIWVQTVYRKNRWGQETPRRRRVYYFFILLQTVGRPALSFTSGEICTLLYYLCSIYLTNWNYVTHLSNYRLQSCKVNKGTCSLKR